MRRPVAAVLARPKSRIFKVQSDFTTMLLGFRSCPDKHHKPDLEEQGSNMMVYMRNMTDIPKKSIPDCKHTYLHISRRSYKNSITKVRTFTDSPRYVIAMKAILRL